MPQMLLRRIAFFELSERRKKRELQSETHRAITTEREKHLTHMYINYTNAHTL